MANQRRGKRVKDEVPPRTRAQTVVLAIAVVANVAALGPLALAWSAALDHASAVKSASVIEECVHKGRATGLDITTEATVTFEMPFVLNLEPEDSAHQSLLCIYSVHRDQPRVVDVLVTP